MKKRFLFGQLGWVHARLFLPPQTGRLCIRDGFDNTQECELAAAMLFPVLTRRSLARDRAKPW